MGLIYGYWGSYTPFKKIATIEEGDVNLNTDYNQLIYKYGLDNERRKMEEKQYTGGQLVSTKTKFYSSNYEKESITAGGNTIDRELFYIFAPDGLAAILEKKGSNRVMYYASTDKLGSINLLVKEDGSIATDQSYNAWGRLRNPVDWTFNNLTPNIITDRGFTGHEHLNYFSLINMNGRAYDPTIGQFLSPDVFVQEPENSQSFNRFSYCLNNPLKFVDPSGYLFELGNWEILRRQNGDVTYSKINDLGGEEFQILNYAEEGPNGEHYQTHAPYVFEGTTEALANSILKSRSWKNATSKPDNYDPSAAYAFCDIFEKTIFKTAVAIPTLELSSAFQFSKLSLSMISNFIADFSISILSLTFPKTILQLWHRIPLNSPFECLGFLLIIFISQHYI